MKSACGVLFFMLFCLIFGGVFLAVSYGDLRDYLDSGDWTQTQGEVISSYVQSQTDSEGDTTYRPYVEYRYTVGDEFVTADRLNFGSSIYTSGRGGAQDKVDEYPAGRIIEVYYNPDDPEDAVIERDLATSLMIFAGIGALSLLFGIGMLVFTVFGVGWLALKAMRS